MAVEERNAPDDGIGETHHQLYIPFNRSVCCIQPLCTVESNAILGVDKKVYLMYVEWMHFLGFVPDPPVMKSADGLTRDHAASLQPHPPV
jgi:hypothetical protein